MLATVTNHPPVPRQGVLPILVPAARVPAPSSSSRKRAGGRCCPKVGHGQEQSGTPAPSSEGRSGPLGLGDPGVEASALGLWTGWTEASPVTGRPHAKLPAFRPQAFPFRKDPHGGRTQRHPASQAGERFLSGVSGEPSRPHTAHFNGDSQNPAGRGTPARSHPGPSASIH